MTDLFLSLAAFILAHTIPAVPGLRARLTGLLGERVYIAVYALVSAGLLAWLIQAALTAPYLPLWYPAPWQAWVPIILMPIALWLLVAGLASANPLSISLFGTNPDIKAGAIVTVTRHPVLCGFALWSMSHMVPNGDVAALILFGSMTVLALGGIPLLDRKARQRLGSRWADLARPTSVLPFAAILDGRGRLRADRPLAIGGLVAAVLSAWLLLGGHVALFGVDPLALALG
ncbi:MAG: NnrU family protein [Candidatus Binatia bacterium]